MTSIVVGVDPSAEGQRALQWALREAVSRKARLAAVRAWTVPPLGVTYGGRLLEELQTQARNDAERVADEQLKLAVEQVPGADGVDAAAVTVLGPAARVLVEAGKDASLIVVGARATGALSRAVLGSVASSVLHHAGGPVVVVPAAAELAADAGRVLVGVDHSPASQQALSFAVDMAHRTGRPLVPVLVHQPIGLDVPFVDVPSLEASEWRSLQSAAEAAGATGLPIEPEVLIGHPAAVLHRLARPQDLLVVGSRGLGGFAGLLLGSTSTQVAQHAACPVAVVRGC